MKPLKHEHELFKAALAQAIKYAETFEICEYGRKPTPDELNRRLANNDFFLREATEKGELLYAA